MMTKVRKRIFLIALCVITVISSLGLSAYAASPEETVSALRNEPTKLICVSKYGDTAHYPENSIEGMFIGYVDLRVSLPLFKRVRIW